MGEWVCVVGVPGRDVLDRWVGELTVDSPDPASVSKNSTHNRENDCKEGKIRTVYETWKNTHTSVSSVFSSSGPLGAEEVEDLPQNPEAFDAGAG